MLLKQSCRTNVRETRSSLLRLSGSLWWPWLKGGAVAAIAFAALGTVSALWSNPLFIRMTPAGGWEVALLALLSMLFGVYVAVRRPACADRAAGTGGVLGFIGVACPVCNKVLLMLFGSELLLTYFEPIRLYVAAGGAALLLFAVMSAWRRHKRIAAVHP
jgi:hypothetical protein